MLEHLSINSLGVIEETTVELDPGFNVVTGETGAGKTMVVTALNLLLGARADAGAIRAGDTKATVEAGFVLPADHGAIKAAEEAGAILDEDNSDRHLVITRAISASGSGTRSRATAGGRGVPVALLSEIGEHAVAIHGQSDQLRLKSTTAQRHALDAYGGRGVAKALVAYRRTYTSLQDTSIELQELMSQAQERALEAENLQRSLEEIDNANIEENEDAAIQERIKRLESAEEFRDAARIATTALSGDDYNLDAPSAESLVEAARQVIAQTPGQVDELEEIGKRLASVGIEIADITAEISQFASSLTDEGPAALNQAQSRLAELNRLKKLYGPDLADVVRWAEEQRPRLDELHGDTERIEYLEGQQHLLSERLQEEGAALTTLRQQAGKQLGEEVTKELHGLLMPTAQFSVAITPAEQPGPHGLDEIALLLQPHPGSEPRPLGKGASGGELSRIMLALEVVLANTDPVPTFIFDEIDAGVGGEAAVQIGRRLARLAKHVQVIVVTHLPQVAAYADRHLRVNKAPNVEAGFTTSDVSELVGEDRISELARMLAGHADSTSAREHAKELLETSH
ncbi:DNA repair protein RecN [Enteractinococcus coprophilus]|uniref:DNA repair protein RecN n=1 Tax=Enteractinococcus coprophilus TaxID=1027633 RepID=A0A543AJW8_9MICC|nr:DNA repair protein RecN [Enteractinococcus coprophilus]TQL72877.1 DNA replication and repair protein RecN [Enteractinococcus coprophilus]